MDIVIPLVVVAFGISVLITAFFSRYHSMDSQVERYQVAVEAEKAIRAQVRTLLEKNDINAGLASTLTKHVDDPALRPPDGLDTESLSAAELQWLADVGELPWAQAVLAERVNRAIDTLTGKTGGTPVVRKESAPYSDLSNEDLTVTYGSAWIGNRIADVDPIATEIRHRGGRIDGYGRVVFPEPGSTEPLPYQ